MIKLATAFLEECENLATKLEQIPEAQWQQVTLFKNWTIYDTIEHLYFSDMNSLLAINDGDKFKLHAKS